MVGTIGIGLMGISANMEMNPAITAAAVISGAYFGDTTSPLSDSANLTAGATGVGLYEHLRETVVTSGLALAIALAVFLLFSRPGAFDASAIVLPGRMFRGAIEKRGPAPVVLSRTIGATGTPTSARRTPAFVKSGIAGFVSQRVSGAMS